MMLRPGWPAGLLITLPFVLAGLAILILRVSDFADLGGPPPDPFVTNPKDDLTLSYTLYEDEDWDSPDTRRTSIEVHLRESAPKRLKHGNVEFRLEEFPQGQGVGTVSLTLAGEDGATATRGVPVDDQEEPATLWLTLVPDDIDEMIPGTYLGRIIAAKACEEGLTCEQEDPCARSDEGEERCEDRYTVKDVRIEILTASPTPEE